MPSAAAACWAPSARPRSAGARVARSASIALSPDSLMACSGLAGVARDEAQTVSSILGRYDEGRGACGRGE